MTDYERTWLQGLDAFLRETATAPRLTLDEIRCRVVHATILVRELLVREAGSDGAQRAMTREAGKARRAR